MCVTLAVIVMSSVCYMFDVVRWCGTGGFQEQGQCLFVGPAARSLLSPTVFSFSSFFIWVGVVELGSSD